MATKKICIDVMDDDIFVGQVIVETNSIFPLQDKEVKDAVFSRYPHLRDKRTVRFEFGKRKFGTKLVSANHSSIDELHSYKEFPFGNY